MEKKELTEYQQIEDLMSFTPEKRKQKASIMLSFLNNQGQISFILQASGDRLANKAKPQGQSLQNEGQNSSNGGGNYKKDVENDHIMILLSQMLSGKKINQIHQQNKQLSQYTLGKLNYTSISTLKKIAKILITLLPNNNICYKQFYDTFFKKKDVLSQYLPNHCNLIPVFSKSDDKIEKLLSLGQFEKNNRQYLKKGYGNDYLPQQIQDIIKSAPTIYASIRQCYYGFNNNLKRHRKALTPTPTAPRSLWDNSEKNYFSQRIHFSSQLESLNI